MSATASTFSLNKIDRRAGGERDQGCESDSEHAHSGRSSGSDPAISENYRAEKATEKERKDATTPYSLCQEEGTNRCFILIRLYEVLIFGRLIHGKCVWAEPFFP
jgi:hypothetical protein